MLLKDMDNPRVEKECNRTDLANSNWYNQLIHSGQFYNPLTKKRDLGQPNSTKEISIISTEADLLT